MVPLVHPFIYHLLICQSKWHMTHWKVYDTQCYLHISIARRSDARARARVCTINSEMHDYGLFDSYRPTWTQ